MPVWKRELVAANANLVVLVAAVNTRFKTHFMACQFFMYILDNFLLIV